MIQGYYNIYNIQYTIIYFVVVLINISVVFYTLSLHSYLYLNNKS